MGGVYIAIRADKPTDGWRIITSAEIIQPRLFVVDIPPISEGIKRAEAVLHAASLANRVAPRIVLILYHNGTIAVKNGNNIALQVMYIGILGAIKLNNGGLIAGFIEEV